MPLEEIHTPEAFESSAPLSQAIRHGDTLYVSGNVAIDPDTAEVVDGGVAEQTEMIFENIQAILEEADTTLDSVIRAGVYLTDMDSFDEMNAIYEEYMSEPYPARTAVKAELANPDFVVEIDVVVAIE